MKIFATLNRLLKLLLLENIVDRVLFPLSTNCFIRAHLGETLTSSTRFVFFKSPCNALQVSTLRAQLGLGSEVVDCYRDATSVTYAV